MAFAWKFVLVSLAVAVPAFFLSTIIWPNPPGIEGPTGSPLALLILYSAIDSIAFGAGVALLIFGLPRAMKLPAEQRSTAVMALLALVWIIGSWWPHDNLHRAYEGNYAVLAGLEYGFHFTIIIAGAILLYLLWKGRVTRSIVGAA